MISGWRQLEVMDQLVIEDSGHATKFTFGTLNNAVGLVVLNW